MRVAVTAGSRVSPPTRSRQAWPSIASVRFKDAAPDGSGEKRNDRD